LLALGLAACSGRIGGSPPQFDAGTDGAGQRDVATGDATPTADAPVAGQDAAADGAPGQDAAPDDAALPQSDAPVVVCPGATAPECSPGSGTGDNCFDATSCYVTKVQGAVNGVITDHPEWFDRSGSCAIIICDINLFMDAVVAKIVAQSLCAIRDPNAPDEEVTVKHDNEFSENFDIVASTGCARTGSAIFTSTCAPAWW
jgi:hypothetical protein